MNSIDVENFFDDNPDKDDKWEEFLARVSIEEKFYYSRTEDLQARVIGIITSFIGKTICFESLELLKQTIVDGLSKSQFTKDVEVYPSNNPRQLVCQFMLNISAPSVKEPTFNKIKWLFNI